MIARLRSRAPLLLEVGVVVVFCALLVGIAVTRERGVQPLLSGDYAVHFGMAVALHYAFSHGGILEGARALLDWSAGYPPLSYLWTAVVFGVVGVSEPAARLGQLSWYLALVVSVYLCLRSRAGRTVALLGLLLAGTSVIIAEALAGYSPDLAVAASAFVTLWILAESRGFTLTRWSLGFGMALGVSLLCKWSAPLYLALPVAAVVGSCLWTADRAQRVRFVFLAVLLVLASLPPLLVATRVPLAAWPVACGIALPLWVLSSRLLPAPGGLALGNAFRALLLAWWMGAAYYARMTPLLAMRRGVDHYEVVMAGVPWEVMASLLQFLATSALFGFSLLLPVGLLHLATRRSPDRLLVLLALSLGSGMALTTWGRLQSFRYYAPFVPMIAVLGLAWLSWARPWVRVPVVVLMLVTGGLQGWFLSGTVPSLEISPDWASRCMRAYRDFTPGLRYSDGTVCRTEPVLRTRLELLVGRLPGFTPVRPVVITVVTDTRIPEQPVYSAETLQSLALVQGLPLAMQDLLLDGRELRPRDNVREAVSSLLRLKDRFPGSPDVPVTPPPDLVLVFCEAGHLQGVREIVERATGRSWRGDGTFAMPGGVSASVLRPPQAAP